MHKKIFLIIGASSDLGCALIKALCKENESNSIQILAHFHEHSTPILEIAATYPNHSIQLLQADLSESTSVQTMIHQILAQELVPTHMVSFAADTFQYTRIPEWNQEAVNRNMAIQVYSIAALFKVFLPLMAQNHRGRIVLLLSSCTIGEPPKFLAEYTTVKYALLGLLRSAAVEYMDQGVELIGLSPSMIETKFIRSVGRRIREMNAMANPRQRNLTIDDVIPSLLCLLSEDLPQNMEHNIPFE